MTRILVAIALLCCLMPSNAEAGRRGKSRKVELRTERVQFRREKLASGVTLTRAKTAMYRAKTAANITGLLNPVNWIFGGLF